MNSIEKQILIDGRYSLREPLGSGGMAEVFLARDEVLERDVALKILKEQYAHDESFVKRFRREARSAASLSHPHIVHIYDWGRSEAGGAYYMAMEYVPGGTLKERILKRGALLPSMAVEVASQIAWALDAAHKRGMFHRDVKSQNVLLTASGDAKVADFGIVRAANATASRSRLILGTANYMSPEQAKGEPVGPQSDLYSLGVVLYEMLTGEVPYKADTPADVAIKHVTEPPRSPREANPEVPEGIDALTLRLLAKDPAGRYGSASELVEDLRRARDGLPPAFTDGEPVAARQAILPVLPISANPGGGGVHGSPYVVYGKRFRKHPLALAVAFVALLVLLGVAAWGPWSGSQELAQTQDVARGSLDGLSEPLEGSDGTTSSKEEAPDVGSLAENEGWGSSTKANTANLKLLGLNFSSSDAGLQQGSAAQNPRVGIPVEPAVGVVDAARSSGPERVSIPEVSGGSAEEASRVLSNVGHVVAGTTTRRGSEPAGTVIGTDPTEGSVVERGTAVSIVVSSGSSSQEGTNGGEDEASAPTPEETTAPTQPSKTRKRDQKPLR